MILMMHRALTLPDIWPLIKPDIRLPYLVGYSVHPTKILSINFINPSEHWICMAFGLRYKTTSTILSVRGRPCETKDKLKIENNARQNLLGMANAAAYTSTGTLGLGVVGGVGQRSQDKAGGGLRRLLGYIHLAVAHRRWGPRAGEGWVCALLLISGLKTGCKYCPYKVIRKCQYLK